VQKWVPKEEEDGSKTRLRYISQNLVDLGEMNLAEADSAIRKMSAHTNEMYQGFVKVFETPGADLSSEVSRLKKMEDEADLMMQDITEYLVKCSAHDIREEQAASIAQMIRIVSELEEITDTIYRLVKLVERKYNKDHQFSEHQTKRIGEMTSVVGQALSAVDNYILQPVPPEVITSVKSLEDQTDNMRKTFNKEAIKRMAEGDIKVEMIYTDINNQLEALANHTLNVMEASSQATPPTT
jgi:phosphate:Na+ symporter